LDVDVNLEPSNIFSGISLLNVECEVVISHQLKADLDVMTNTGSVTVNTIQYVNLTRMQLSTNTGSVGAYLNSGTTLWDDIEMSTNTGSVYLQWDDIILVQNTSMTLTTNTGSVDLEGRQARALGFGLEVSSSTQTGGVTADIDISGNVSAEIDWSVVTGGTDIHRQVGFSQDGNHMESNNFPAEDNISIHMETTTGSVDIWAEWNE
jgi:hypothetical protein